MRNSVYSDTIEAKFSDVILYPLDQIAPDVRIALVQIRKISQSAIFDLPLVVPIVDRTVGMVVVSLVQRVDLREIRAHWSDMVSDDVDHHPNAHRMTGIDKFFQRNFVSKMGVDFLPVTEPVAMIAFFHVFDNWRDPNSVEAEVLDVLKLLFKSGKGASTIFG